MTKESKSRKVIVSDKPYQRLTSNPLLQVAFERFLRSKHVYIKSTKKNSHSGKKKTIDKHFPLQLLRVNFVSNRFVERLGKVDPDFSVGSGNTFRVRNLFRFFINHAK